MIFRKAEYKDAKILNNFLTLLIKDEKQYDSGIDENFTVTNMYENYIEDESKFIMVAEEENKIVGYLYGKIEKNDETYKYKVAKLDALYIDISYRHRGIAKTLIMEFKKWARLKLVDKIEVNVWSKNIDAKSLYEKANFKTVSETMVILCEKEK